MKKSLSRFKFTFIALSVLLVSSCDNTSTLTDAIALDILIKYYGGEGCFSEVTDRTLSNKSYYTDQMDSFGILEAQGLVVVNSKKMSGGAGFRGYTISTWTPTQIAIEKYKLQSKNRYKVTEVVVTEVTGISINPETKTAIVKFKYERSPTPFYNLMKGNCKVGTQHFQVEFVEFDTGWEIKKV